MCPVPLWKSGHIFVTAVLTVSTMMGPHKQHIKTPSQTTSREEKKQQGIFSIVVLHGKIYVLHLDNFFLREHNESKHASNFCLGPAHSQFLDKYSCHTITQ